MTENFEIYKESAAVQKRLYTDEQNTVPGHYCVSDIGCAGSSRTRLSLSKRTLAFCAQQIVSDAWDLQIFAMALIAATSLQRVPTNTLFIASIVLFVPQIARESWNCLFLCSTSRKKASKVWIFPKWWITPRRVLPGPIWISKFAQCVINLQGVYKLFNTKVKSYKVRDLSIRVNGEYS